MNGLTSYNLYFHISLGCACLRQDWNSVSDLSVQDQRWITTTIQSVLSTYVTSNLGGMEENDSGEKWWIGGGWCWREPATLRDMNTTLLLCWFAQGTLADTLCAAASDFRHVLGDQNDWKSVFSRLPQHYQDGQKKRAISDGCFSSIKFYCCWFRLLHLDRQ